MARNPFQVAEVTPMTVSNHLLDSHLAAMAVGLHGLASSADVIETLGDNYSDMCFHLVRRVSLQAITVHGSPW